MGDINNSEIIERYIIHRKETNNNLRWEKRKYVKCIINDKEVEYRSHRKQDLYQWVKNLKAFKKKGSVSEKQW